MSNFNPINFFNKFNSYNTHGSSGIKNANDVQNIQLSTPANIPNPVLNVKNSNEMPFFMLGEQNLMNNIEKILLLKQILQLPKDIQEFLNNEIIKENSKVINSLVKNGSQIKNISAVEIMSILNSNVPEATKKLSDLMLEFGKIQSPQTQKDLKEMIGFLNTIALQNQNSDASQIIKNFLLFYLPISPFNMSQDKNNLDFELELEENKENNSQIATVTVTTKNYGIIKCILELRGSYDLVILINSNDNFPSSMLEKLFFEKTKSMHIEPKIIKENSIQKNKQEVVNQNVKISTSASINSYLLFAIYSLIRLIIEIDNSNISSK